MNIDNKLTFGKEYDSIIEEPIYGNYYTIKNNLVGIIDKEGKVIIENNYLQIMPSYKGYYDLRSKKGLGLFSLKHGLIIPATYDKIEKINDKFFVGVNGSIHNDIYNYKSNKVIKSDVKIVDDCGGNTITSGGFDSKTHGYYEEDTEVKIVEFKYKSIVNKEYEHYLAQTLKGKYVILDAKFKEVTPKHDAFLQYSGQSSIGFEQDGLWGLIDLNNNVIIKPKYELIYPEIEGYIVAQLNEKYGVINNKEEIIIPFEYELLGTYTNGVFLCVTEEISGYVDLNNIVYSLQRHNNSDYVYYQDQNKELGPLKTPNELNYVFEDSIIFEIDEKVGWIDGSGKIILDALYDEVSNVLYGGLGFVKKDDKWAFYDRDKGFITEFIYDEAGFLIKGYCLGKVEQNMALISNAGEITPCKYKYISYRQSVRNSYFENKGWLNSPGSMIFYSVYLNCWLMNDLYTKRRSALDYTDDVIRTNFATRTKYIQTNKNDIDLNGNEIIHHNYELDRNLQYNNYTLKELPQEIISSKIDKLNNKISINKLPDYNDSSQRNVDYFEIYQPTFISGIKSIQQRFLLGFVAAATKWLYYRFDSIITSSLNKEVLFMKIDALIACSIKPRYTNFTYGFDSREYETKLESEGIELTDQEKENYRFLNNMVNRIHYITATFRNQTCMTFQEVAEYIFSIKYTLTASKQKLYMDWVENVIEYGMSNFPTRYQEDISNQTFYNVLLDDVVSPNIYYDPTKELDKKEHLEEMKQFLKELDLSSPYLNEDEFSNEKG